MAGRPKRTGEIVKPKTLVIKCLERDSATYGAINRYATDNRLSRNMAVLECLTEYLKVKNYL